MRNMENQNWVLDIETQLKKEGGLTLEDSERKLTSSRSIYTVPKFFRNHNKEAFRPHIVSFGPYHHDGEQVKGMESLKRRSVLHFLKVTENPLKIYLDFLGEMEYVLRDYYAQLDTKWEDKDRFLQLMFMDGCFMLEILLSDNQRSIKEPTIDRYIASGIFRSEEKYILGHIRRDMLLIENQLPLQVLVALAYLGFGEIQLKYRADIFVKELIQRFFSMPVQVLWNNGTRRSLHILDMYLDSVRKKSSSSNSDFPSHEMMPSAIKLNEAGFKFKKSHTTWLDDMAFKDGVLTFPKITVNSVTESIFLNLMAYEFLHSSDNLQVVSYVAFCTSIVHTSKDVSHLRTNGIISNLLGSEEEVTKMFYVLSKAVRSISVKITNTQENDPLFSAVKTHYNKQMCARKRRFREWRRNLHDTYFKNPWTSLSVLAAVILLALTIAQTIYTILSFYKEDSDNRL